MSKRKVHYTAYVQNDSGAGERAGNNRNLNELKSEIRRRYGRGWIVIIDKIEQDSGIMDFPPVEVARFRLRK